MHLSESMCQHAWMHKCVFPDWRDCVHMHRVERKGIAGIKYSGYSKLQRFSSTNDDDSPTYYNIVNKYVIVDIDDYIVEHID